MSDTDLSHWANKIRQAVDNRVTVTAKEFRELFGLTRRQVQGMIDRGDLVVLPTGSAFKTIPSSEVHRYLTDVLAQDRARADRAAG